MAGRTFSDTVQLGVIKSNLEKNNGTICCELCGKTLLSINDCHFDHIIPYAKGGTSTLDNCQILCVECNLKKSDKALKDLALEEKARRFLSGQSLETAERENPPAPPVGKGTKMTKEIFDGIVGKYIEEHGNIRQIDFSRESNHLPGISYMIKYYGTLAALKEAFGVADISANWNRETIRAALANFIGKHKNLTEKDMKKENGLPSINCVLHYFPECKNFSDIKRLCGIDVRRQWTKEEAVQAGKAFVAAHGGKLTQDDCIGSDDLPGLSVVCKYFGSMIAYKRAVGATLPKNLYVSPEDVDAAVRAYFGDGERIIPSRVAFFEAFPYGIEVIRGRYGSFEAFAETFRITVLKTKKAKYTKEEVDKAVSDYVRSGRPTPRYHDLVKEGLPAAAVIMRYYEHWQEPFEIFRALYEKIHK